MLVQQKHENNTQVLDSAIQGAHAISKKLFLFEAARMSEKDIRKFLRSHQIVEKDLQDKYIDYVYMYRIASL